METLTLTSLRKNLFKVADHVLATGEPVVIERDGRRLVLSVEASPSLLDGLPKRDFIIGDPEDLVGISAWDEAQWRANQPTE